LLCAGLIGWRSLVIAGEGKRLGLYGFGAAAHILAQVAVWQGRSVFAFTRPGDIAAQDFARSLGAKWAGGSDEMPPEQLDAAIIFATVGDLVPLALKAVRKGGRVVCAGIHMSDIPSFPMGYCGKSDNWCRSPISRARTGSISFVWRPRLASSPRPRDIRWSRPTKRSPISARAASKAPRFWFPEALSVLKSVVPNRLSLAS
jgi:hypothetical protein